MPKTDRYQYFLVKICYKNLNLKLQLVVGILTHKPRDQLSIKKNILNETVVNGIILGLPSVCHFY